ncbi:arsenite resistance protein arsB [Verticillium alfalfae VaMs.102]|uniref:Arsenite resistance protein arsB n=1 Tax=Verticillium alfalfae (strain VaMs.102 / ATCC MYA-4576 / FGSC 10136) TaxID=526221 RepID=C9SMM9_VERA1|nr:arsenite resistance protein arsB [Verticillium alfalfae VaMs.102]EEY20044.1 arsenite resistance protein arsB [Verticillium alfalfae VaMs.102]
MTTNTTVPLAAEPKIGPNEVVNVGHGPKTERSAADVEQQVPPTGSQKSTFSSLGILDRYLAVWIFLAMLIGILLGNFVPSVGPALQKGKFVGVSVPIDQEGLRNGLILVGVARCIAMVLIWTNLAGGDNDYCAILVAVNSFLQIVLFAPVALLFLRVIGGNNDLVVSYSTVATAVGVFLGIPLGAAIVTRLGFLLTVGADAYSKKIIPFLAPWSLIGLLYTIVVLFGSQGAQVVHQIVSVVRVAAPLLVYFTVIFFATLFVTRRLGFRYGLASTQAFTAASNNFELAIAIAVASFGADSDEALATTVGPLIEVPVLIALVYLVKWYARKTGWKD